MSTWCFRIVMVLSLTLAVVVPCAAQTAPQTACTTGTLQTPLGPICGKQESVTVPGTTQPVTVSEFLGVRYAQTPVRWKNPVALPTPAWSGTFAATQAGSFCAQNVAQTVGAACTLGGSEDCLFLNIYVPGNPTPGANLPVMVFIHGGAFVNGAGSDFDGSELAANGNVIVVTLNYRLGALGFLALKGLDSTDNNFGFRDQIMALQWVKSYISFFGGNAANVTIFGQSAGAMSVGLHALSSPQSREFFQKALMESNPLGLQYKTLSNAEPLGTELGSAVGCTNTANLANCLQQTPLGKLVCAQLPNLVNVFFAGFSDTMAWSPAIDGSLITGQPMALATAGGLTVPMAVGTNLNEGTLFADIADQKAKLQGNPFGGLDYNADILAMFVSNGVGVLNRYPCPLAATDCSQVLGKLITDYVFTCANRNLAKSVTTKTNSNSSPSQSLYLYQFTRVPPQGCAVEAQVDPNCASQVCHGQELPYVFDTPQGVDRTQCVFGSTNPSDQALSNSMQAYWSNLAKGQSPNASGLFGWPAFAPLSSYLILNQNLSVANVDVSDSNCDFWDTVGYEGPTFGLNSPASQNLKSKR